MGKLRVLFFIESLGCGGAEKSLVSLLQLLDYNKLDVSVLTVSKRNFFKSYIPSKVNLLLLRDFTANGIRTKLCSLRYSISWRLRDLLGIKRHRAETYWRSMSMAFVGLKDEFDVAVAYQQGFPTYYIAEKVKSKTKIAWINTDLQGAGYDEAFNAPFYGKYTHIVAVSQVLYNRLCQSVYLHADKLSTIYDILNVQVIERMAKEYPQPTIPRRAINLVTVGRIEKAKNYTLAVETARVLHQKGIDFIWTFVGAGSEKAKVADLSHQYGIDDHINFVGMQSNPYPYIYNADIYVQTSSFEGFGMSIAEAKILNKPIVATNFPVVYDQITNGINGLIADMNPESVSQCILSIINDDNLRNQLIAGTKSETNTTYVTEVQKFYRLLNIGL